jgi:glycosyltransferase involved in cell wall biosynthesis
MNIAWITYDWFSDLGGKGVACTALCNELSKTEEITLIDIEFKKGEVYENRDRLAEAVQLEVFDTPNMLHLIKSFPLLWRSLNGNQIIVIGAAPNIDLVLLPLLLIKKWWDGARIIRIEYTNPFAYLRHSKLNIIYTILGKTLLRYIDHTITPTKRLTQDMTTRYGISSDRCSTIPWPTIPEDFDTKCQEPVPETLFNEPRSAPVCISVMRLSLQDKDFPTLISAWKQIYDACGGTLAILGNGDRKPIQQLIKAAGVEGSVMLLGAQTNPYAYIAKSDLMLFASHYEGNPLVISEALVAGCPVVATDCDYGPSETVIPGENGYLVPIEQPDELAKKAIELLNNPSLRKQFGEKGKEVRHRFEVASIAEAYRTILNRM